VSALAELDPRARAAVTAGAVVAALAVGSVALPQGVPAGVVALGLVYGATTGLTALGLVLIHRASRVVSFAQAEIGGLAVAVAVLLVTGSGAPYAVGVVAGLVAAGLTGAAVHWIVVRRFRAAPRLLLTVATIGVAQVVGAAQLGLPSLFGDLRPLTAFTTPFHVSFEIGAILFTGDHIVAVVVALAATVGLWALLTRSDVGIAIRAAADGEDRARLLGIPVARLSLIAWVTAAVLSGLGALVLTPIQGVSVGAIAGPSALLPALTAAVIARMTSLPTAMLAALGLGVFEQLVFWSYPRSSVVSVVELGVVLLALLLQRRALGRTSEVAGETVPPVRPVPPSLRAVPAVAGLRRLAAVATVGGVLAAPALLTDSQVSILTATAIYAVIGVSLVILVGWAGQVSLGQFAFVGIGAGITAGLITTAGVDLFVALAAAVLVSATAAVVVGLPALRIPGLFLAVATLALAVPVSEYLLSAANFPAITPAQIERPELLGWWSIDGESAMWWCSAAVALAVLWLAANLRRSRVGRVAIAVRDNERAASLYSVNPPRTKLLAFALAGGLAGLAGGLYVLSVRGVGFGAFNPNESLEVFTMVVVGGLGSLTGAVLGAAYLQLVANFLEGGWRLLATGAGMLVLLLVFPGGLGQAVVQVRDRLLERVARARGIPGTGFTRPEEHDDPEPVTGPAAGPGPDDDAVLQVSHLEAGYGGQTILHGVTLRVGRGEVLALLGTNGAGKSTLLRAIAGLIDSDGDLQFDRGRLHHLSPEARVAAGIAMVPGGAGVFPNLTVAENVRAAGWLLRGDVTTRVAREAELYERFPRLQERTDSPAGALSGGEQQMLAIGMAAMHHPRLLLVDELSLGLAPTVVGSLLESVQQMAEAGTSVLVVEQSLNVAAALADRAVFLERGRVRFDGPTADLAARGDIARAVFLGSATDAPRRVRRRPRRPDGDADRPLEGAVGTPGMEVLGATVRFGGIVAVDDVTVRVAPGEIVGLIGSNGAGKTTLLDVCSGFTPARHGRVLLGGTDVTDRPSDQRAALGLGRVFQDARLFPALTVAETVAVAHERFIDVREPFASGVRLAAARRSEAAVAASVDQLLHELGLAELANQFVAELSTGTRRIVELACVLAHRPATLLLDEPSSGLAQRESEALTERLRGLRDGTGMSMLVVEHDIPMIRSLADRLVCMHLGRAIAEGPPDAVLADPLVIESYLGTDDRAVERSGSGTRGGVT
jgi:ABC-type branched-subunit amino acid transport system ATPase component/ABC-type branched-subunit amino acid transport system permease subunit